MAMPSLSSPQQSGRDSRGDLFKSILGTSKVNHSGNGNDSTEDSHSESDSGSTSSSGTSSGSLTPTRQRSGNGNFSTTDSESDSMTESQRGESGGSFIEKPQNETTTPPVVEDTSLPVGDTQSDNTDSESVNGNNATVVPPIDLKQDDEEAPKRRHRKKRVKTVVLDLKTLEKKTWNSDPKYDGDQGTVPDKKKKKKKNKENLARCERISNRTNEDSVSQDTSSREHISNRSNEENNSQDVSRPEHVNNHSKRYRPRPPGELSKRAQRTLNLYPEELEGPDRLERTYAELQALLQNQFIENQHTLNGELVHRTKRVLGGHRHRQAGYAGHVIMPPPGAPPGGRRVRRIWSASGERSRAGTQTDMDQEELAELDRKKRPQSAKGYYFIDTTKPDHGKHVTFVKEREPSATYEVSMRLGESHDQPRGRDNNRNKRRPKSAGNVNAKHKTVDNTHDNSDRDRKDSVCSDRSLSSPAASPSRKATLTDSDSSPSRSRSRSRSTDRFTDHLLKNTDNVKIKEWLKYKNRKLRKQRREERKIIRHKQKQEAEQAQEKLANHDKSVIKVQRWMEDKQREARLLQRQRRNHPTKLKFSGKVEVTEAETTDLKECENKSCKTRQNGSKKVVNMAGEETVKCTCGFVEMSRLQRDEERQAKQAARVASVKTNKPRPPGVRKSGAGPTSTSSPEKNQEEEEEKRRLSYDNWLNQKKSSDLERRKQEKQKMADVLASSDTEMDSIVSGMAKRRAKNILRGKKRIDTGVKEIDDDANKTLDERLADKQQLNGHAEEVAPSSGSSARFYRWVPKDGEEATDVKDETDVTGKKRPKSAKVQSSSKQVNDSKRPASAKPGLNTEEAGRDKSPRRSRSISPKPKLPGSAAYRKVKYQRKSWDEFSDHVWEKLNEDSEEGEEDQETVEESRGDLTEGAGDAGVSPTEQNPQEAEDAEDDTQESPDADLQAEDEAKSVEESTNDLDERQSAPEVDHPAAEGDIPDINILASSGDIPDINILASSGDIPDINILASSGDTLDQEDDGEETTDLRQSVANQCIKEVVAETIFSMTELETADRTPPGEGSNTDSVTPRSPSVLENISEETEENGEQSGQEEDETYTEEQEVNESTDAGEQPKQDVDMGDEAEEQSKHEASEAGSDVSGGDSGRNSQLDEDSGRNSRNEPMRMC